MANKEIKNYKRSNKPVVVVTEDHRKCINAYEKTSQILKFVLIAVVLLSLVFSMFALVKVQVNNKTLENLAQGKPMYGNISYYDLFSGYYAKSTYDFEGRGIHIGYNYPHVFDYIVGKIPALSASIGIAGPSVFAKIEPAQDKQLDQAYVAMKVIEIISLVWLVAMAVMFALSFVKKLCPSQVFVNGALIIHFVLNFIMWIFTIALAMNSTPEFMFMIGIGMWLNLTVAVVALGFVIANIVYKVKMRMYENA